MRRGKLLSKDASNCKVAAIQMVSTDSVKTNLTTMSAQVKLAASKGAELVVVRLWTSQCCASRVPAAALNYVATK